jgi:phage portal protein BeeE
MTASWPRSTAKQCFAEEPVDGVPPILHLKLFHPADDHYGMSPMVGRKRKAP